MAVSHREAGVELANRVESELFDDFARLARSSGIGHKRQDLTKFPVLFHRAFPYQHTIVCRNEKAGVEIVGVLHAKRGIKKILKQRNSRWDRGGSPMRHPSPDFARRQPYATADLAPFTN